MLTRRGSRRRARGRGFTLAEVVTTTAILAALAAIVVPAVASRLFQGRVSAVMSEMMSVAEAVRRYQSDVGRYPFLYQQLAYPPAQIPAGLDLDSCLRPIPAALGQRWRGPYVSTMPPAPDAFVSIQFAGDDSLYYYFERDTITDGGNPGPAALKITIFTDRDVALRVDSLVEGRATSTPTLGVITIPSLIPAIVSLEYRMPVWGC